MGRTIILAGNYKQFMDYCQKENIHPRDEAIYAAMPQSLIGVEADKIIEVGTCHERDDYYILKREAKVRVKPRYE